MINLPALFCCIKTMKKYILATIFFVLIASNCFCQGAGTTLSNGLEFEELCDARAGAMGRSVSALDGDISFIHHNPAGIASIKRPQAMLAYNKIGGLLIDDMYFANISYGQPFPFGVLGVSFSYFNAGAIDWIGGTTINAQNDLVITAAYAVTIMQKFSFGANFKVLSQTYIEQYKSLSYAFDVGYLVSLPVRGLNLGIAAKNIGPPMLYYNTPENLPMNIKTGLSYGFLVSQTMKADINAEANYLVNESSLIPGAGLEFIYDNMIAIRTGCIFEKSAAKLSFGAGFTLQNFIIEYAYEPAIITTSQADQKIGLKIKF